MRTIHLALCLPWYNGADRDCVSQFLVFSNYLGKLKERLWWLANGNATNGGPPPLDSIEGSAADVPSELIGAQIEYAVCDELGCSLPGMARERTIDSALAWGADYCLMWDADIMFANHAFLRLLLDDKPIVAALAFTGRDPITPVIYSFDWGWNQERACEQVEIQPVHDYKRDELQRVDAIGGGMMLIKADVFRQIKKPWFHSPGLGEDIWFCMAAAKAGVEVWVDTRVKTVHKPTFFKDSNWASEQRYLREIEHVGPNPVGLQGIP